ncbi:hypothetical protein [Magnetospirillum sp. 15-1]|uniref:hypothetical protein n=1 Tax=Magnetospirillum sp. 15-1 TaxID=1979370 RepID=UPI000BBC9D35|nr:hypothetical protein [Magnetospirillum sp. 15-1]
MADHAEAGGCPAHILCKNNLRRAEASLYLGEVFGIPCATATLAKLASISSDGPPFYKYNRTPLYPRSELDAWALSKLLKMYASTSEYAK